MDNRRRGEDLLPRLAPLPRSLPQRSRPGRASYFCRRAPGVCRGLTDIASRTATVVGRGLTVLPVLELLGIGLLVLLLGR